MRLWLMLLLVPAFAGCLGNDADGDTDPPPQDTSWAARALPLDHDHSDPSLHVGLSSSNVNVVGWDPLVTDYHGAPSGGYFCGEVSSEGERRLAVVNSFTSNTAIVVVDVTDPAAPEFIGELVLPNTHIYDSAITDDGRFAILASSPLDPLFSDPNDPTDVLATQTFRPELRTPCGTFQGPEDNAPFSSGVILVDLTDPTAPAVTDFRPRPAIGPHSVSSTTIDGVRHVLASTTNLAYTASTFSFFTVEELPGLGGILVDNGEYSANYQQPQQGTNLPLLNGHVDGTIAQHPVTGDTLAYLANWDEGLIIVRVDGPGQITPIATWGARDPSAGNGMTGAIHTAYPAPEEMDGRTILVTGQEIGGRPANRPTGQIVLLDITDPAAPEPVARWTLPVDIQWSGGLTFSTHYVALQDGLLYTALYHGGVWIADADPANWPELPSVGVFMPDRFEEAGEAATCDLTPEVLDVFALGDGKAMSFDSCSGAYVFEVDAGGVAQAGPWTEDAWI